MGGLFRERRFLLSYYINTRLSLSALSWSCLCTLYAWRAYKFVVCCVRHTVEGQAIRWRHVTCLCAAQQDQCAVNVESDCAYAGYTCAGSLSGHVGAVSTAYPVCRDDVAHILVRVPYICMRQTFFESCTVACVIPLYILSCQSVDSRELVACRATLIHTKIYTVCCTSRRCLICHHRTRMMVCTHLYVRSIV